LTNLIQLRKRREKCEGNLGRQGVEWKKEGQLRVYSGHNKKTGGGVMKKETSGEAKGEERDKRRAKDKKRGSRGI